MPSAAALMWNMIFGVIGLAFFVYGKKASRFIPILVGIALSIMPFLISNVYILVAAGFVLILIPFFVRE